MKVVANKYEILEKLGEGNFGAVYRGINIHTNNPVAIKMESANSHAKLLKNETKIYHYLGAMPGIPELKWFGLYNMYYCMVISMLGDSLSQVVKRNGAISLNIVCMLGIKIIQIIESIHKKGFIHRDIKPDNFLFGVEKKSDIHLVDFGFCKRFIQKDGTHIPCVQDKTPLGTLNYVSVNVHTGCEPSRRDDMESILYILLFMIQGNLEWSYLSEQMDYNNVNVFIKTRKIFYMEQEGVPAFLREMWKDCRSWSFEQKPKYEEWIDILNSLIIQS
jgi:serine/threonine protein kinase